jgi:hypothetical protein
MQRIVGSSNFAHRTHAETAPHDPFVVHAVLDLHELDDPRALSVVLAINVEICLVRFGVDGALEFPSVSGRKNSKCRRCDPPRAAFEIECDGALHNQLFAHKRRFRPRACAHNVAQIIDRRAHAVLWHRI